MSVERPAQQNSPFILLLAAALGAVFMWSFWTPIAALESVWRHQPDYSHGYLVLPIALLLLWTRRQHLRAIEYGPNAWGLLLLLLAFAVRWVGQVYYIDPLEYFSMVLAIAGACLLLGGGRFLLWALPAIGFLVFLFPLPYTVGRAFSLSLQRLATIASCWVLQSLGHPAFSMGNVIDISGTPLEVAQACSGLRMLMSFVALSVAFAVIAEREWWEKTIIIAAAVPIAIVSNIVRIVVSGILFQYGHAEWANRLVHDGGGIAMMPIALFFLFCLLWYLDHLFVVVEADDPRVARQQSI